MYNNIHILPEAYPCKLTTTVVYPLHPPGNNPCSTLICRDDQECHVDRSGEARCTCPPPCESVVRPVCGDNSQTYANECELRRAACQHTMNVRVAHEGECSKYGKTMLVYIARFVMDF